MSNFHFFDELHQQWWDPKGPMATLHHITPLRIDFIKNHTKTHGKSILDVGCGGGLVSLPLADLGAKITGIDMAGGLINVAQNEAAHRELQASFEHCSLEEHIEKGHQYDCVLCMDVLEHVPSPEELLHQATQCLKPGGMLMLSTINRNLKAYLLAVIGAEYITGLVPKGTHDYKKFLKPSELLSWARACHLELIDLTGFDYNPVTNHTSYTESTSVNYLMCLKKS